ncbi:MAG: MATE family efflux transporter [Lachnospiraceae bacterium]|nr:MATE family efflux transporter [Lachnospiraceae bacterium]
MERFRKKYIGDKAFYSMLMSIAVPIMIQNAITNFVSLLDNIMVGRIGTEQMSGVAIVNQIMFIFFLCLFGGHSGAGIFTAQYYGYKDDKGIQYTFRYKLWIGLIITAAAIAVMHFFGSDLIGLYLNESSSGGDLDATLRYGLGYMRIIFFSMPLVFISLTYSSTLRECGETVVPMRAGIIAVFVNLAFNYLLIYGKLGFPKMGVYGAAVATDISRLVECVIIVVWLHTHAHVHTYIRGVYRSMLIPFSVVKKFFVTGAPLLINETLWATGIFLLNQAYSMRGLNAVAGQNIANTINNVFNIAFIAMGDAVAIIVGQLLGAGKMKEAKDTDNKIIASSVMIGCVIMVAMILTAPLFPRLYNTNAEAKHLATLFLIVYGIVTPKEAFLHASYFTIRSGGKTVVTFLFDSVFMCLVSVPLAFVLSRYTDLHVIAIFAVVHAADLIKCVIGYILVKKNVWMKNIVA